MTNQSTGRVRRIKALMAAMLMIMVAVMIMNPIVSHAEGWGQDSKGWYYTKADGSYYKNEWLYTGGGWYYFNSDGYMMKGLQEIKGEKYYLNPSKKGNWAEGRMMTGWQLIDGKYMYFGSDGVYNSSLDQSKAIKGVDVSQYQGTVDWQKMKDIGISFAFVRVGHGGSTVDPYFKTNMNKANEVGIKCGVYYYSTAESRNQSLRDAQWVIDQLQGYNVSYPVAIDLEASSQTSLGKETITEIAKAFCDEIKKAGYTPMVYCNETWAKNYIDFSKLSGVYKWVARYNGTYNTDISRDIWQAGSTTLMDSVTSNSVDIDFGYTDFSNIVTARTSHASDYVKTPIPDGEWKSDSKGYWFQNSDGSYKKSEWYYEGDKWYYFDSSGYLLTGWFYSGGRWYYLQNSGMLAGEWINSSGIWYYMTSDGSMATGWAKVKGTWYYFSGGGAMQTGWIYSNGVWYYLDANGGMMESSWINSSGTWYYLTESGGMATGWKEINGYWYYFYGDGRMASNTTIDGYVLDGEGRWIH